MKLRDAAGHGVDLWVSGYQFPDADDPRERFSWHIVAGKASTSEGEWDFQFAALECDETPRVSAWLRQVHSGERSGRLQFTEPNLQFAAAETLGDGVELCISLDLEFLPPWSRHTAAGDPFVLNIAVNRGDILTAADAWDKAASRFAGGA